MNRHRLAFLIVICVLAHSGVAGSQELQPIANVNLRLEIPGISVLPPQGEGWFVRPVSEQESAVPNSLIRLVQRRPDDEARQVLAGASVSKPGGQSSLTPKDFLQNFTGGDPRKLIGEMITERQRLIDFEARLDGSLGATCIRYRRLTEITGQFPAFRGLVGVSATQGLYCRHPRWPEYNVDVTFQQTYAKGEQPLPLDAESDAFLRNVVFTSSEPVAPLGLKWHLQAGERAYFERRWPEAEVSFAAALKQAESLGSENLLVAQIAYFLGSTRQQQNRISEADALFRRVIDLLDAEKDTRDSQVASIHALALNDLGVISVSLARHDEAERLYLRALAIREKSDRNQLGRSLSNLTQLYMDLGRWTEAIHFAERSVSFYEQRREPGNQNILYQLDRLARILRQAGREAQARDVEGRALAIRRR